MKIGKLDRRHNGYGYFMYGATFTRSEYVKFCEIRDWCWDQWGRSCEKEFWHGIPNKNPAWCWINDMSGKRIKLLFGTAKEFEWFILRWK